MEIVTRPYWFRRETEPDPTTPKPVLRYTGKLTIWKSPGDLKGRTEFIATVDSLEVARQMVRLANKQYEIEE